MEFRKRLENSSQKNAMSPLLLSMWGLKAVAFFLATALGTPDLIGSFELVWAILQVAWVRKTWNGAFAGALGSCAIPLSQTNQVQNSSLQPLQLLEALPTRQKWTHGCDKSGGGPMFCDIGDIAHGTTEDCPPCSSLLRPAPQVCLGYYAYLQNRPVTA